MLERFANRDALNQPWAIFPLNLPSARLSLRNLILIGNFGDGRILVFSTSGTFFGYVADIYGTPFSIDGLWGIAASSDGEMFLAAGINDEADGLIANITMV